MGFDYFYGFVGGDANQWGPNLFRNTTQIYPWIGHEGTLQMDRSDPKAEIWPVTGKESDWNLITAMADDAIAWMDRIHQNRSLPTDLPPLLPRCSHAPHHPTKEWVDKITAMHLFDDGYEKLRERIFENQKKLGVIPPGLVLTPWPKEILTPWDELSPEAQKLFIRQANVFAAYVAYSDYEIGRVIQAFRGPRQARQHARHLSERRQRHQCRGRTARHVQRGRVFQRRGAACGCADEVLRSLGDGIRLQPHDGRLVLGV